MNNVLELIEKIGIVPVVKVSDPDKSEKLAQALKNGGLPCAEITFRTDCAAEVISRMKKAFPDMCIGAGTVLSIPQAKAAVEAGAQFIVSPGYVDEVVDYCVENKILVVPGCSNASEIAKGANAGLEAVKFFPAEQSGGIKAIKSMAAPYGNMKFMATGGINENNLYDYLSFKKVIACGGSWMVPDKLIEENKFDEIERISKSAVDKMLGFDLAHIGLNLSSADEADSVVNSFDNIFGLEKAENPSSIFAGSIIEAMKAPYLGANGHIAIKTNFIERAIYHLGNRGVAFNEESTKYKPDGSMVAIYLEKEIGGFAVHLVQKAN